ncbi:MAG: hypothetical protein HKN80_06070 [Acidimicrobiia bacterium]|nr:hypothetical protein [Acidimicrobiia bacterium]
MEPVSGRTVEGSCGLRRVGRFGFPVEELVSDKRSLASLGRDGSLRMFFGSGRRIQLADGSEWRIKSTTSGRHIVPMITSAEGPIAISGPLHAKRSYGINGKDYGLTLIPMGKTGLSGSGQWVLRRHEDQIATVDQGDRTVSAIQPIPLGAVIMAFTLITHGIPGEGDLMPKRD